MSDRRRVDRRRRDLLLRRRPKTLTSVGAISAALTPALGAVAGKVVFGAGVLGASMVAAIVASLALAWGVGEIAGYKRTLETRPFAAGWFAGVYALWSWAQPSRSGRPGTSSGSTSRPRS